MTPSAKLHAPSLSSALHRAMEKAGDESFVVKTAKGLITAPHDKPNKARNQAVWVSLFPPPVEFDENNNEKVVI